MDGQRDLIIIRDVPGIYAPGGAIMKKFREFENMTSISDYLHCFFKVYQEIEKLILEDLPVIPLFRNSKDYVLVKPWVKGYQVLPLGIGQWRDIFIEAH